MHACLFVHVPWTKFVAIRGALHLQSCTLPAEIDSGAAHERGVWLVRLCAPTCSFFLFNYSHETKETRTRRSAATKQSKAPFTYEIFWLLATVAFLFLFDKNYLIMKYLGLKDSFR